MCAQNTERVPDPDDHPEEETDYLDEVSDGCGCDDVWEHLSEHWE